MAFSKSRILMLGHSFLRRLEDDINAPYKPQLHCNFGLEQCEVFFVHDGGWKISANYKTFLKEVRSKLASKPSSFDVAIIQIGGNDLCLEHCEPLELASKIDDFGQWLQKECLVKVVYVCELFTRPRPRYVSPETYESRRSATNMYLETFLENTSHVKLWRHRRIFNSPNNLFIGDGTHLNNLGTKKFYESLKRSVILAAQEASLV